MTRDPIRYTLRVRNRIRRVSRFARQASHARAACAGLTGAIFVLAIVVDGGHGLDDLEALSLASIVGLMGFLTWALTDRSSEDVIVRRADERLDLGGALLAAFENGARPERPLAELGARRALGRATFARLRTAAVPPFEIFLVLPLVAGVVLFRTIEARDGERPTGISLVQHVNAVAAGLQRAAAAHQGELSEEQMAELAAAVGAAQATAQAMEDGGAGEPLGDLIDALDGAAASLPAGSALAEELGKLAFEAEAASADTSPETEPLDDGDGLDQQLAAGPPSPGAGGPTPSADDGAGTGTGEPERGGLDDGTAGDSTADLPGAIDPEGLPGDTGSDHSAPGSVAEGDSPSPGEEDAEMNSRGVAAVEEPPALDAVGAAPAPWWPRKDDDLVRAWLAQPR